MTKDRWTVLPDLSICTDQEKVEHMVRWFRENFEDAAERTPYESAEGGYQFIWGGPYDAREVLEEMFGGFPPYPDDDPQQGKRIIVAEELVDKAVEEIEDDGCEWVPVPHPSDYE